MSWFFYGDIAKRRRRRGLCLRPEDLPPEILAEAGMKMRHGEHLELVTVLELRPKEHVLLECLSRAYGESLDRHTRFTLLVKENPQWVCEGDIGRGWKQGDDKP